MTASNYSRNSHKAETLSASLRRRIMAALRMAHRVLGVKRRKLGLGQLGANGGGTHAGVLFNGHTLSLAAIVTAFGLFGTDAASAQNFTSVWSPTAANGTMATGSNWTGPNPFDTAGGYKSMSFGTSQVTDLTLDKNLSSPTSIAFNNIAFTPNTNAKPYTITIGGTNSTGAAFWSGDSTHQNFAVGGTAIDNTSGVTQNFVVTNNGILQFAGTIATIGNNQANVNVTTNGTGRFRAQGPVVDYSGVNLVNNGTFFVTHTSDYPIGPEIKLGALSGSGTVTSDRTLVVGNLNTSTTFSGPIQNNGSDKAGLNKVGTGTLTLGGTSTYTGPTTVSAGTLAVNNTGKLASNSATNVKNGAILDLRTAQSQTVASLASEAGGKILLGATGTNLTFGSDNSSQTIAGEISGAGGLTKVGTGTQTVTAAQTYTGGTNVNGGTLALSGAGALASTGSVSVDKGAALDVSGIAGTSTSIGTLKDGANGGGAVNVGAKTLSIGNDNGTGSFGGNINGTGSLLKDGTGVQTVTGTVAETLKTTVDAGQLILGPGGVIAGSATVKNGATLGLNDGTVKGTTDLSNGGKIVSTGTSAASLGAVTGTGTLDQNGTGTTTVNGAVAASVASTVNDGKLIVGNGGSLAGSNTVNKGTLEVAQGGTVSGPTAVNKDGTLGLNNGTVTGTTTLNNGTIASTGDGDASLGTVDGTGALNQNGTGTTTVNGAVAEGVTSTVNAGKLVVGPNGSLAGSTIVNNGGTLGLNNGQVNGPTTLNGGLISSTGDGAATLGAVSGTGALNQDGPGTTTVTGAVASGVATQVNDGNLIIGQGGSIAGPTTVNAQGVLTVDKGGELAGATTVNANGELAVKDEGVVSGATTVEKDGILSVSGGGQITGTTTMRDGATVAVGDGGTLSGNAQFEKGGTVRVDTGGIFTGDANTGDTGTLIFNGTDQQGYAGNVTGNGNLIQNGTGTTTVTGDVASGVKTAVNDGKLVIGQDGSIAGPVAINKGTLEVAQGGSLTGNTTTAAETTLAVTGADDKTLPGNVSGSGTLAQNGSGTTTVTGDVASGVSTQVNDGKLVIGQDGSIAGPVAVNKGTLEVGNGGTLGGNVATQKDTSVAFNPTTTNQSYGGVISGAGSVVKDGAGTTTLTAQQNYTGPTTINDGKLVLTGDGGLSPASDLALNKGVLDISGSNKNQTVGAFSGSVGTQVALGDKTLTFGNGADTTFGGTISGNGGVIKEGTGTTTFSGVNTYTGDTLINQGTLLLADNASLAGHVVVNGGSFGGNGTVDNLSFAPGTAYTVNIKADGWSNHINVIEKAGIGGASVNVLSSDTQPMFKPSTTYNILTAGGGLDGTFAGVNTDLAFLTPTLSYDPTNVYLTMTRNDVKFGDVGHSGNQRAVGEAIDSIGMPNELAIAVASLSADQARGAFDSLSGELYGSVATGLIENTQLLETQINNRIRAAFDNRAPAAPVPVLGYGPDEKKKLADTPFAAQPGTQPASESVVPEHYAVWGSAFGSWGHTGSDGNADKLKRSTGGFVAGIDGFVADDWMVGAFAGYSHSSFKVDGRSSSASSDNYHLGVYGGGQVNNLALRMGATYTWNDIDAGRQVAFPGFYDSLESSYRAGTAHVFGELGYKMQLSNVELEPFANLSYVNVHTKGFSEDGGAAALSFDSANNDMTFTTLGLRASTEISIGETTAVLSGTAGWRHAYGDLAPVMSQAFDGSSAFSIAGVPIAKNAAVLEAGLDFNIAPNATLGLSYQGQIASDANDQSVKGTFKVSF